MGWYNIKFSETEIAEYIHYSFINAFGSLYNTFDDGQKEMVLYDINTNHSATKDYYLHIPDHRERILNSFILSNGAVPCPVPDFNILTFLVGDPEFILSKKE